MRHNLNSFSYGSQNQFNVSRARSFWTLGSDVFLHNRWQYLSLK